MTWCNNSDQEGKALQIVTGDVSRGNYMIDAEGSAVRMVTCPSCGHNIELQDQGTIHNLPGLPSGVKFDPSDQEIIEHLEAKAAADARKVHPLIDEFIPTLEGENGICYTHPEKLPGVSKDGQIRHFFHRPSKAYTTGTRKRRKVHGDADRDETRWHKTGKTRPVLAGGVVRGFKKILVLYTNYGRQRKPEKTNWVMHQYHLGGNEDEKDGELVMSKVFYQTQPRQCGSSVRDPSLDKRYVKGHQALHGANVVDYYSYGNSNYMSNYDQVSQNRESPPQLIPNLVVQGGGSPFIQFTADSSKGKLARNRDGGGG